MCTVRTPAASEASCTPPVILTSRMNEDSEYARRRCGSRAMGQACYVKEVRIVCRDQLYRPSVAWRLV